MVHGSRPALEMPCRWEGHAGNPRGDVHAVIEIRIVRRVVHLHPLDGLATVHAFFDQRNVRRIRFDVLVAIPTRAARRHIGVARLLHKTVAIPAIHSQLPRMNLMRKGDRLRGHVAHPGVLLREVVVHPTGDGGAQE